MLFRRKPKEEASFQEKPPGGQPGRSSAGPEAALHDDLGVHHLWYLELRLREELARASRAEGVFSLCGWRLRLLPGESLEAALLARAAALIVKSLRPYDIIARIDEQRFAAILLDADYQNAATVAYRIKADLQTRFPSAGRWQAGVASFSRDGVDGEALIHAMFRRLEEDARAA